MAAAALVQTPCKDDFAIVYRSVIEMAFVIESCRCLTDLSPSDLRNSKYAMSRHVSSYSRSASRLPLYISFGSTVQFKIFDQYIRQRVRGSSLR